MFRLICFEWRKTYTNCALVFTFLIFLLINIFNIAYQNQQKSYFADSKEWRSAYWELYPTFSGVITAEKAESLMALYRPLAESVSDLTFNTAQDKNSLTGINQYSDYLLLDRFYVTPMQYFVGYGNYATSISQKALENFKYYSSTDNSYEAKKSLQIYTLFSDRRISSFAYTEPFEHLTSYTFSSVLILCICLLGTSNLFSQEHECHMFSLIKTTKYGNRLSIHAKLITSLFFSIFVSVCFSICDLVAFYIIYGNFDGASLPLYALKSFSTTSFSGYLYQYLLIQIFSKIIALIPFTFFISFLSALSKTTFFPFLISASAFSISLLFAQENQYSAISWVKVINPASLLRCKELYFSTSFVNIFNEPILIGSASIIWCIILGLILYFLTYIICRKRNL